ncbi:MAG: DEAD/DEAH box helicase [Proteobacteria bacterium]|nr:DEAD/DEAH box helicase [Pseudomonadota bacterium]
MSSEVRRVADTYLKNPQQVQVNRTEMVPTAMEQRYYVTHDANKPEVLRKLIDAVDDFYGLVFCQTKALVTDLTMYLLDRGYRVDSLHGDKSQAARELTMRAFRDRKIKLLICTDVAARGLDVKDVSHVINYSIPKELDSYVHRIGRTARCGKSGFALSLISPRQRPMIAQIERMTKSKMIEGVIPTRKELGEKKVAFYLNRFNEAAGFARAMEALGSDWKAVLASMPVEELAGRFLALSFPEIFSERDPERTSSGNGFPSQGFPASGERSQGGAGRGGDRPRSRDGFQARPQAASRGDAPSRSTWRDEAPRGGSAKEGWDRPRVKPTADTAGRVIRADETPKRAEARDKRSEPGDDAKRSRPRKKFGDTAMAAGNKFPSQTRRPVKKTSWSKS